MYTKEIENIDKQIEELYIKRAEFEMKAEAKRKEEEQKKEETRKQELESIKNAIKEYNKKYEADADKLVLATEKKFDGNSIYNLFPWW